MTQRIAILGAGVMGETLLAAILGSGHPAADLVISEKRDDRAAEPREQYDVEVTGNAEAVTGADTILLVVKPQDVPSLLAEIVERRCIGDRRVARGRHSDRHLGVGAACWSRCRTRDAQHPGPRRRGNVRHLRRIGMLRRPACCGEVLAGVWRQGGRRRRVAAGCCHRSLRIGPGIRVLSGRGHDRRRCRSRSRRADGSYARLPDAGRRRQAAGRVARDRRGVRRRVTSPNGTTAAAIATFDERGVKDALVAGVLACVARSAELSKPTT